MNNPDDLKLIVKEKYAAIASQHNKGNCCGTPDYSVFSESYGHLKGYEPDADMQLGCGLPTEYAKIKPGYTVIDLGSGAGNDCFVARSLVGEKGLVIGIDMVPEMIDKARANAEKLGYNNVKFRLGEIEKMPVTANKADVVISNCVLNLVPDKLAAFREIIRVLKPGGHLSVSDVVTKGKMPEKMVRAAELYAGCISGAVELEDYLQMMKQAGLTDISIQKEREIHVPESIMRQYIDTALLDEFKKSGTGIYSITVYARKPAMLCGCYGH